MTTPPDPIQAQLIAARRNQILDAATKVFADKGFHPTTIKDIARTAGIADGTIYNYFENKTALMLGIFDRLNETDRRAEDLSQFTTGDFRAFMRTYLRHRLTFLQNDNFEVLRVVIAECMVNKELRELFNQQILAPTFAVAEEYFQQWAAQHIVKPINISLTMRAISGMVLGLIVERLMGDQPLEAQWDELPAFLTDLIMDGLL
ncbi:TetR/AcrR family transcriptional regulator [Dictyobacter kobayashii]|uniref:Transcriptional regulator n=1 Tax=Dictyobacter kobayashii TaxID=2014872 RepID=A0A402AR73_9CHLR|nr:TetR/AcrR family transcriptional regulator [Dictyobacter kobayashii]GCE21600.1 transcriptional regulator [Dictyobacter kobayashii]